MQNVCLQIFKNNRMLKISLISKKNANYTVRIRNAKFSGYDF